MQTVLVTGATGFVGRRLTPVLVERGLDVRAMTRRPEQYDGPGTAVGGDVHDPASLDAALEGADVADLDDAEGDQGLQHLVVQRPVDAGGQLVVRQVDRPVGLPRREHGALQRDVGRRRVDGQAGDVLLDGGEGEAVRLELLHELEPGDVVGGVVAAATAPDRRRHEAAGGVEPHVAHAQPDPGGELVEGQQRLRGPACGLGHVTELGDLAHLVSRPCSGLS